MCKKPLLIISLLVMTLSLMNSASCLGESYVSVCKPRWAGKTGPFMVSSDVLSWRSSHVLTPSGFVCYRVGTEQADQNATTLCKTINCNGDLSYCSNRTCNSSSAFYCRQGQVMGGQNLLVDSTWVKVENLTTTNSCSSIEVIESPVQTYVDDLYSTEIIEKTHKSTKMRLRFKSFDRIESVVIRYSVLSRSLTFESDVKILRMDKDKNSKRGISQGSDPKSNEIDLIIMGNVVDISLLANDGERYLMKNAAEVSRNLTNDDYCSLGECDVCETKAQWANCRAYNFGYFKLVVGMVVLILAICMLPWLAALLGLIAKCFKCLVRGIKCCVCCSKIKSSESSYEMTSVQEPEAHCSDEEESEEVWVLTDQGPRKKKICLTPSRKLSNDNTSKAAVVLMIVIFAFGNLGSLAQCTGSIQSETPVENCRRFNNTHTTCDTLISIQGALMGVGSILCVGLKTTNGTPYGQLEVKFQSYQARQQLVKTYHTADYTVQGLSARSCGNEGCGAQLGGGGCQSWIDRGSPQNPCNLFPGSMYERVGRTGCIDTCMCTGCGCGWCFGSAPLWWRYSVFPGTQTFIVNQPGLVTYEATLAVTFRSQDTAFTRTLTSSEPFISNDLLSATLNGIFTDFGINWGGKSILISDTTKEAWIVDASPANLPRKEAIGDIQADTKESLNTQSFRIPSDLVTITNNAQTAFFTVPGVGVSYRQFAPKLPAVYTGFTWTMVNNELIAPITRSLTASINLGLKSKYKVYYTSDLVCPDIQVIDISGCYKCGLAAVIRISYRSKCQPGVCSISSVSGQLLNTTISLTNEWVDGKVLIYSGVKDFNTTLSVVCPEQRADAVVRGSLIEDSTVDPLAPSSSNYSDISPPSGVSLPSLSVFGLSEQASQAIVSILVIVGIIIVIIIAIWIVVKIRGPGSLGSTISLITGMSAAKKAYSNISMNDQETESLIQNSEKAL